MVTSRIVSARSSYAKKNRSKKRLRTAELEILELAQGQYDHHTPTRSELEKKRYESRVSSDPSTLWIGGQRICVSFAGCEFSIKERVVGSGKMIWVVYMTHADQDTGLADIAGTNIYLSIGQIRAAKFGSPLVDHSDGWEIQRRIWKFLNDFFIRCDIKHVQVTSVYGGFVDELPTVGHTSDSFRSLAQGVCGWYALETAGPRAILRVGEVSPTQSNQFEDEKILVIELTALDVGHTLEGHCATGTRIPHAVLANARTYDFMGPQAHDMEELWLYLLSQVA